MCEEILSLMGKKVLSEIVERVKLNKYYSISVESSPDEAYIDQLTVTVRYIEGLKPFERILTFIPNCGSMWL